MCSDQNVVSVGVRILLLRLQTIYLVSGLISTCNQRQEIEELLVGCGGTRGYQPSHPTYELPVGEAQTVSLPRRGYCKHS